MSWTQAKYRALLVLGVTVAQLLCVRWLERRGKVLIISLSGAATGSAGDLRGSALAAVLPQHGWHALVLPPRVGRTARIILSRVLKPHAVILQQTRHSLNTPDLYPDIPCVLDVDDADIIAPQHRERIADIASRCKGVITGSRHLARTFKHYNQNTAIVWTGTYIKCVKDAPENCARGKIIAWAPSDPFGYPHELAFVKDIAARIASTTSQIEFRIYGVPEIKQEEMRTIWGDVGQGRLTLQLFSPMPYREYIKSLGDVAVGLQPVCDEHEYSLGKSFGKALAYMAADVSIVASDNIDHPLFFRDRVNGRLLPNDAFRWAEACIDMLNHPLKRAEMTTQARTDFERRLSVEKSAALVAHWLDQWVNEQQPARASHG